MLHGTPNRRSPERLWFLHFVFAVPMSQTPRVSYAPHIWTLPKAASTSAAAANYSAGGWGRAAMQRQQDSSLHRLTGQTMGTTWSLRLPNPDYLDLRPVQDCVQSVLDAVIAQMSNWEPDSLISRFNTAPAGSRFDLPEPFAQVLQAALHWARLSGGAMDPTMGALVSLWGFGPVAHSRQAHPATKPVATDIEQLLRHSGHTRLDWEAGQLLLQPGGLVLDFCGIAKGFAVDWVVQRLQSSGWKAGLFEIGGELRSWGSKPDGKPWQVQLGGQATDDYAPLIVGLSSDLEEGGSFATSGDFWHHFSVDGKRYSHTLDPRTGQPIEHGLSSVTVFHPECMHADALATVLTVLGPRQGLEFAEQHGIAAVLYEHGAAASTTAERHPAMSSAWNKRFKS